MKKDILFSSVSKGNLILKIEPIGSEIKKIMADKGYIDKIMINGNNKATAVADSELKKVYDNIGYQKS